MRCTDLKHVAFPGGKLLQLPTVIVDVQESADGSSYDTATIYSCLDPLDVAEIPELVFAGRQPVMSNETLSSLVSFALPLALCRCVAAPLCRCGSGSSLGSGPASLSLCLSVPPSLRLSDRLLFTFRKRRRMALEFHSTPQSFTTWTEQQRVTLPNTLPSHDSDKQQANRVFRQRNQFFRFPLNSTQYY